MSMFGEITMKKQASEGFIEKGVPKNFAKFTFLMKLQA